MMTRISPRHDTVISTAVMTTQTTDDFDASRLYSIWDGLIFFGFVRPWSESGIAVGRCNGYHNTKQSSQP